MIGEASRSTAFRPVNRVAVTISIMLATIMQGVDTTIANVALPHMQGSLSASQDQIAWVADLLHRRGGDHDAADRLARRPVRHQVRVPDLGDRLHARLGAVRRGDEPVAAGDLPRSCRACAAPRWCRCAQAVLFRSTRPSGTAQAMAVWGMGVMLGPIIGPALGGWLTEYFNWRWVFYINLPVGIVAALGILIFIRETRPANASRSTSSASRC